MADLRMPVPAVRRGPYGGLPQAYNKRLRHRFTDLYDADHAETRSEGRFRWLISTCLAGAVGATAIFVVIYGSVDTKDSSGFLGAIDRVRKEVETAPQIPSPQRVAGLAWTIPRGDRLVTGSGAASTRYIVQESIKERRAGRDYIKAKPYARIVARLAPVSPRDADAIPPFNPLKLYASAEPSANGNASAGKPSGVSARITDLPGGRLPAEDGQELDMRDIAALVARLQAEEEAVAGLLQGGEGGTSPAGSAGAGGNGSPAPYTTEIAKTEPEPDPGADPADEAEEEAGGTVRETVVQAGDGLERLLLRAGADAAQARSIIEAVAPVFPASSLVPGQTVRLAFVPSLTQPGKLEPARFSVHAAGKGPVITVARDASGRFVPASGSRAAETPSGRSGPLPLASRDQAPASSMYAAVYHTGLLQNLAPDSILAIMRVHAYETDFRRRVHPGDAAEFFFDMKEGAPPDASPGELLYSAITAAGQTVRFYRFRTRDGAVDYYDEYGNNSKKFLTIKPVRGSDVRLTSGFGLRFHPLLKQNKMHTGIDWAAPPGTPILAAGNGVVEEAGLKGGYGNYIRIRHANGYQTTYAHLVRFAEGIRPKSKVKLGNVIGYVGTSGLSSGPHLHFEVLVNNRFVNPVSIKIPRERQLTPREQGEFNKERLRIDSLARRPPVYTLSR